MSKRRSDVLFRGYVEWTLNEDSLESLDVETILPPDKDEVYTLYLRNGSVTVDLTAIIGTMVKCYPDSSSPTGGVAVTDTDLTADTFTAAAHGLKVGDAVTFSGDGGGVTAGTVYYVISTADANTFQVSTTRGGSAFNVDANDETNTATITEEFFELTRVSIPKFAAASSTAVVAGLEAVQVSGWPNGVDNARINFAKSAAEAAAFKAYCEVRRS